MSLGVTHDGDPATGQILPYPGVDSAQSEDVLDREIDVIDENVEVEAHLSDVRLVDRLEVHEGPAGTKWL